MQCDHMIEARRSYIVVVDKVKKETITIIIDVEVPGDTRVCEKVENENRKRSRNTDC